MEFFLIMGLLIGGISFAFLKAYAMACALSMAGMIPSSSHNSISASIASLSVIDTYCALPLSRRYACSGPTPG